MTTPMYALSCCTATAVSLAIIPPLQVFKLLSAIYQSLQALQVRLLPHTNLPHACLIVRLADEKCLKTASANSDPVSSGGS